MTASTDTARHVCGVYTVIGMLIVVRAVLVVLEWVLLQQVGERPDPPNLCSPRTGKLT